VPFSFGASVVGMTSTVAVPDESNGSVSWLESILEPQKWLRSWTLGRGFPLSCGIDTFGDCQPTPIRRSGGSETFSESQEAPEEI
jgi:hypothetical protein